jgi:plastocyanin
VEVPFMRRHVTLVLSLLVVAGGTTAAAGVPTAGATGPRPLVIAAVVKAAAGTKCHPTQSFCYKPTAVSVSKGSKVAWKNPTIAPHNVTRCTAVACSGVDGGTGTQTGLGSPTIASGGKYVFKFTGKGTYNYYCSIHGYALMHGTITVTS